MRERARPTATKFISRQGVITILGAAMVAFLTLTILTFPAALIWIGQPLGNAAKTSADAFASGFSVAFFAAFVLAMVEQQSGSSGATLKGGLE